MNPTKRPDPHPSTQPRRAASARSGRRRPSRPQLRGQARARLGDPGARALCAAAPPGPSVRAWASPSRPEPQSPEAAAPGLEGQAGRSPQLVGRSLRTARPLRPCAGSTRRGAHPVSLETARTSRDPVLYIHRPEAPWTASAPLNSPCPFSSWVLPRTPHHLSSCP